MTIKRRTPMKYCPVALGGGGGEAYHIHATDAGTSIVIIIFLLREWYKNNCKHGFSQLS